MKDKYFEKQAARARQRAKLLIVNPDFQREVMSLRKKLEIPANGFENDESNREWHKKFEASDDEYFDTVWMEKRFEIEKLRKAKKLGYKKIPVVYLNISDIEKEKKLNLTLNRVSGDWDYELLKNFDVETLMETGFDDSDLSHIFDEVLSVEDDEFNVNEEIQKNIKMTR